MPTQKTFEPKPNLSERAILVILTGVLIVFKRFVLAQKEKGYGMFETHDFRPSLLLRFQERPRGGEHRISEAEACFVFLAAQRKFKVYDMNQDMARRHVYSIVDDVLEEEAAERVFDDESFIEGEVKTVFSFVARASGGNAQSLESREVGLVQYAVDLAVRLQEKFPGSLKD